MKKFLLLMLVLGLSLTLVSCKGKDEEVIVDEKTPEALDTTTLEDDEKEDVKKDSKTCEDYYKDKIDGINKGLEEELSVYTDIFTKAIFDCKGGDITYEYTFSDSYKPEETNLFEQDFDSLISATKLAIEQESGYTPDTVTFRYLNSKGKVLFETTK